MSPNRGSTTSASVAIIGMSCQLPCDINDPEALWAFCENARCSTRPIPPSRFNATNFYHPSKSKKGHFNVRAGSFLDQDISSFDATFFNLTEAEATAMDPQHRILLECAFTALENAGLDINALAGRTDVGVFAAGSKSDYEVQITQDQFSATRYVGTGNASTMFANRISYFFNFRGPSMTVDTACSSSLTALHLAVQSLRRNECKVALVGGSFLQLTPQVLSYMAVLGTLGDDGRCFSFDHRADGYGRGEGAGCLVLKMESNAMAAGDSIRALIRNTAVNHCGRSQGITVPSADAQMELIRQVYDSAGLDPSDTAYVEGHGTGTARGDPIEASSIALAFASASFAAPLHLGSVKSNFGHLEAASGILSVLKCVIMLEKGSILPNANFEKSPKAIDLRQLGLRVPTERAAWPEGKTKRASINSFGFGGSNAHAILEEALRPSVTSSVGKPMTNGTLTQRCNNFFCVSAKDEISLCLAVAALVKYVNHTIEGDEEDADGSFMRNLSYTLCCRRTHFNWRFATNASTRPELVERLQSMAHPGRLLSEKPIIFVFTGQGSQWAGMGTTLMQFSRYNSSMHEADGYIRELGAGWSLIDEISRPAERSQLGSANLSQPATTALQISLVLLLESWGVRPNVVCGHSSGEIAAAFTGGILDFRSCMAIAYYRGEVALKAHPVEQHAKGAMLAVAADAQTVAPLLDNLTSGLAAIACFNSPRSLTISGDCSAISELKLQLDEVGIFNRLLRVDVAYHSDHMLQVVDQYLTKMTGMLGHDPSSARSATFLSSVVGSHANLIHVRSPLYWATNLVSPVLFSDAVASAVRSLSATANDALSALIVEVGPHDALRGPVREIISNLDAPTNPQGVQYLPTLRRNEDGYRNLLDLAASLANSGHPVNFKAVGQHTTSGTNPHMLPDLPSYPFNKVKQYWHSSRVAHGLNHGGSPWNVILGHRMSNTVGAAMEYRNVFSLDDIPWLRDHKVNGRVIFPMAGYISAVIEALKLSLADPASARFGVRVREVVISKALVLLDEGDHELFTLLNPRAAGTRSTRVTQCFTFQVLSWDKSAGFTEHCHGLVSLIGSNDADPLNKVMNRSQTILLAEQLRSRIEASCDRHVSPDMLYQAASRSGLDYGPAFRAVSSMKTGRDCAHGTIDGIDTASLMPMRYEPKLTLHPTILDAMLHIGLCNLADNDGNPARIHTHVPTFLEELVIPDGCEHHFDSRMHVYIHNVKSEVRTGSTSADITGFDQASQTPAIEIHGLRTFEISDKSVESSDADATNASRLEWRDHPDFLSSSGLVKFKPPGTEAQEEEIHRLEQASFYHLEDAFYRTPTKPTALHLQRLHDWIKDTVHDARAASSDSRQSKWLALDQSQREFFLNEVSAESDLGHWHGYVGPRLDSILSGQIDPLTVLIENDGLYRIYEESSVFQLGFSQAAELVELLSRQNPSLRILEVGAGTGGCTSKILEKLAPKPLSSVRFEAYDYTDVSVGFFEKARAKFSAYEDVLTFRRLDICEDPVRQGFELASYDLVLAADVIHATPDLGRSLKNIRQLLKPNGILALVELSRISPIMFPFATLPGWWYRENGPFVSQSQWHQLLLEAGFTGVEATVEDLPSHGIHTVIWTHAKSASHPVAPKKVTVIGDSDCTLELRTELDRRLRELGANDVECIPLVRCKANRGLFVCVDELSQPVLAVPNTVEFEALQQVLTKASGILWVTRGSGPGPEVALSHFAFGFARAMRLENASLKFVVLHLDQDGDPGIITDVFKHVFITYPGTVESEVDFRQVDGRVQFPRLVPNVAIQDFIQLKTGSHRLEKRPFWQAGKPLQAQMARVGSLSALHFGEPAGLNQARPLADDELLIEIKATGVNFKDILIALGNVPWQNLGFECSGIVVAAGRKSQTGFREGDVVVHWGTGLYATHVRCNSNAVVKAPKNLASHEAAAIPTVFTTAYECLINVARLQKGEKVLVHAAAGGVGQAAIMLAQWVGAEVFCTVGTPEKKTLLMSHYHIPEDHIFSSRSTAFADAVSLATNSHGVDVILNSLAGEMFHANWRCLGFLGRLVDIGKREFLANSYLEMQPFDKGITYAAVDLSLLMKHRALHVRDTVCSIMELFESNALRPLQPIHVVPIGDLEGAFRTLQSGKTIGKIVVVNDLSAVVDASAQPAPRRAIRADVSYLITGGTGGLGRSLARFLIEQGSRNIILASRSGGDASPESSLSQLVSWASTQNVRLLVAKYDMSRVDEVKSMLAFAHSQGLPAVRGVIHGAMTLKDSLFETAQLQDWKSVVDPKIHAAFNLHHALQDRPLDFFICLSSVAGITGNPGQSSYSGSNTVLDAFCQWRRSEGLTAASISLPAVSDAGYVAEMKAKNREGLSDTLVASAISQSQVHLLVEGTMISGLLASFANDVDIIAGFSNEARHSEVYRRWGTMLVLRDWSLEQGSKRLQAKPHEDDDNQVRIKRDLALAESKGAVHEIVYTGVVKKISAILMIPVEEITPQRPVADLGLDSLIAVELRNWIVRETDTSISVMDIMNSTSVTKLVEEIVVRCY